MTSKAIPENTLVLITTGAEASLYRNRSKSGGIKLESVGSLTPKNLENEGPSGVRPPESSARETDEATFSKQLAEYLYQQAHAGEFSHLVLVADPDTLGEVRPNSSPRSYGEMRAGVGEDADQFVYGGYREDNRRCDLILPRLAARIFYIFRETYRSQRRTVCSQSWDRNDCFFTAGGCN